MDKTNKDIVDPKKFRHTRFKTYQQCPRKHYYIYKELIDTDTPATVIPGKLFHAALEAILSGEDPNPYYKEFEDLCNDGTLELDPKLLSYIVREYMKYYKDDYANERLLAIEQEYTEDLSADGDYMSVTVDQVVQNKLTEIITIRDIKTTLKNLKYTQNDVQNNTQLLLYVPYVEANLNVKVDSIQIDEIRMDFLEEPPINKNGKPTADKKRLSLVTYEAYHDLLCEMKLDTAAEYQEIQKYLQERGHPLFRRITQQILSERIVETNLEDMYATYQLIKAGEKIQPYRVVSKLCEYCQFKPLCDLDRYIPNEVDREIIKYNLKNKKYT